MGLRDLLKKKDRAEDTDPAHLAPEFTFIRSDTHTHEVIQPPSDPNCDSGVDANGYLSPDAKSPGNSRLSLSLGRRDRRSGSVSSSKSVGNGRPLSQRLHLSRSPVSSEHVPQDLPEIITPDAGHGGAEDKDGAELQWEKRATMLARENERRGSVRGVSPAVSPGKRRAPMGGMGGTEDENIQEAIRLHEVGDLQRSTAMFGRLADPEGANNALAQVLYGLALRHGWGCMANEADAVKYLMEAASNAGAIEELAIRAGLKKGGAAKGELVLAIFELANCFRHGWGINKDPVAAKHYYETAANLGDTDAMNEVAWCYLEGFGTKKDKFTAAKYYRLAEENGNKTIGNTWIWKDKYNPGNHKK